MDKAVNCKKTEISPFARMRGEGYALLGSLLGQPPTAAVCGILKELAWEETVPLKLARSLSLLQEAANRYSAEEIQMEFDKLFVGLGSGEIVPYASWYLENRISGKPLARLRTDLFRLGIVRQNGESIPEDAAAALCESMVILSDATGEYAQEIQASFFERHLAVWMGLFFQDLQKAKSASFYRVAGRYGFHFLECESRYLGCHLNLIPRIKRRNSHGKEICGRQAVIS